MSLHPPPWKAALALAFASVHVAGCGALLGIEPGRDAPQENGSRPAEETVDAGAENATAHDGAASALLFDDFESYAPGEWPLDVVHSGTWQPKTKLGGASVGIETDGSNVLFLKCTPQQHDVCDAYLETVQTFGDFELTVRMKTVTAQSIPKAGGALQWHARGPDVLNYAFMIHEAGWWLARIDAGSFEALASGTRPALDLQAARWYAVRVEERSQTIKVTVDDQLLATVTDATPIGAGTIYFQAYNSAARFDDLVVR